MKRKNPTIPPEIQVNGKWRPTRNSLGKVIHSTPEGLVAFWKWFGDSQVVDEQGRPLVVYHSTNQTFEAFDLDAKRVNNRGNPHGVYVSTRTTDSYGTNVMPLYARAYQPYFLGKENTLNSQFMAEYRKQLELGNRHMDPSDKWFDHESKKTKERGRMTASDMSPKRQREVLLAGGFDSIQDGPHWGLLHTSQVKSATSNRGTFDPEDPVMTNPRRKNPTIPLPPDFFPSATARLRQMKAIREEIYKEKGIWFDDLNEMMETLHDMQAKYSRSQFKLVKGNPASYPVISYAAARKWEPEAARRGVSQVARSGRGFMRAYQRAGTWARLPEAWKRKRNAFVARHMAQGKSERLWAGGKPSRRALALIMWAYMPPRRNPSPDAERMLRMHRDLDNALWWAEAQAMEARLEGHRTQAAKWSGVYKELKAMKPKKTRKNPWRRPRPPTKKAMRAAHRTVYIDHPDAWPEPYDGDEAKADERALAAFTRRTEEERQEKARAKAGSLHDSLDRVERMIQQTRRNPKKTRRNPSPDAERIPGARMVAERMKQAETQMRYAMSEQFGLTDEQTRDAMAALWVMKLLKRRGVTYLDLKDGRIWDKRVLLDAAGTTQVAEALIEEEGLAGASKLKPSQLQHAIDTFGVDCTPAMVKAYIAARKRKK